MTDRVIRTIQCAWCPERLQVEFVAEEWDAPNVEVRGGHLCPNAPTRHLLDDTGERAA